MTEITVPPSGIQAEPDDPNKGRQAKMKAYDALRTVVAAEKQRADDIREILSAALLSEEAFSIAPLTDTEASDLSYVLVKALAAQGAPPAETCVWTLNIDSGRWLTSCGAKVPALGAHVSGECDTCGKRIEEAP